MNQSPRNEVRRIMRQVREHRAMPSSECIVLETFKRLGFLRGSLSPNQVLLNFNDMLHKLWEETLITLETYEEQTYATGIPEVFISTYPDDVKKGEQIANRQGFAAGVLHVLSSWYPKLRRAFLSVGQGRMARGGKDFELQIQGLFDLANIPYDKQERTEHTDFMLPSADFYKLNRVASAIISVKRTLRERWAEVAEELFNLRASNVFLFTADKEVRSMHIETICGRYNIHLVLWDSIKSTKFNETPLVLGYSEWASQRLPMLRQYWH